jgi:hypothetical protein
MGVEMASMIEMTATSLAGVRYLFYPPWMPDRDQKLSPADPSAIAESISHALL